MSFIGTIKTAIALYDGVTSPLKSMHKAMGMVLNTFEAMQEASEKTVDTAVIRAAREEWAKAGTAFDAIEETIRRANDEQNKFNRSIREGTSNANGLLSTVKKLAVAVGGVTGLTKVLNLSDDLASTRARLNLIVDDKGSLDTVEQRLNELAERETTIQVEASSTGEWEEIEERYRGLTEAITLPVEMVQRNEAVPILKQPQEQTVEQTMFLNDEAVNQSTRRMEALEEGVSISAEVTEHDAVKRLEEKIMASAQRSRAAYFDTASAFTVVSIFGEINTELGVEI